MFWLAAIVSCCKAIFAFSVDRQIRCHAWLGFGMILKVFVEMYLTAYLAQPAALGGSRWHLLWSWQRSELLWPWASCLMHDTSCSPAAGAPPAELYHPSSSALAGAESLINKKEKDSGYIPQIHLKNKLKNMNDTMSNTRTHQDAEPLGNVWCQNIKRPAGPKGLK